MAARERGCNTVLQTELGPARGSRIGIVAQIERGLIRFHHDAANGLGMLQLFS